MILTRFNLPTSGSEGVIRAQEDWLRHRVGLFEDYCLPSVEAQTCKDFEWLVYFDPESPGWLREKILQYAKRGSFRPIYRESANEAEILSDIEQVVGDAKGRDLITTNLDNDDAIGHDFVARIQTASTESIPSSLYLRSGLIRRDDRLYLYHYSRNAFNSVRSSWSRAITAWAEWHTDFERLMPVVELGGSAAWMQIVHGANVSNRIKGQRVASTAYRFEFGQLLNGISEPSAVELLQDRCFGRPIRFIRDTVRSLAKRLILRSFGREGLDRSKELWRKALAVASR